MMSSDRLVDDYDVAFFDLDGVIYLGPEAIEGAVEGVRALHAAGIRVIYITNNAARSAESVAAHLRELGFEATSHDLITSAQAAAHELQRILPPGSRILVSGTKNLVNMMTEAGFIVVSKADEEPVAVIQGYDPHMTWPRLDEAAIAVQRGARWFATNTDSTRPTERGLVPGAGAAVAAVRNCVDIDPTVFGKPYRPLLDEAARRTGARRPIFVGDRIDTDIVGAVAAGMDSLMVFTGAHGKADLVAVGPSERPTAIGWGVPALLEPARTGVVDGQCSECRDQLASLEGDRIALLTSPDTVETQLDALWAVAILAWQHPEADTSEALARLTLIP